jgi:hypothetical protein
MGNKEGEKMKKTNFFNFKFPKIYINRILNPFSRTGLTRKQRIEAMDKETLKLKRQAKAQKMAEKNKWW